MAQLKKKTLVFPEEIKVGHCVGNLKSHILAECRC